jgi:hypothetical protein
MSTTRDDNVSPATGGDHDAATEAYLKIFDDVDKNIQVAADSIVTVDAAPDVFARCYELVDVVKAQQKAIEGIYNLMVEMNNYFGNK